MRFAFALIGLLAVPFASALAVPGSAHALAERDDTLVERDQVLDGRTIDWIWGKKCSTLQQLLCKKKGKYCSESLLLSLTLSWI